MKQTISKSRVAARVLPRNPSFDTVPVQVCCSYAHAHITDQHLQPKRQIRRMP